MYYLFSKNKGADQLRGNREADLRLCFRIYADCWFSHVEAHILIIMHFRQLSTPDLRLFYSFMMNASKVFYVEAVLAVHVYYALIN